MNIELTTILDRGATYLSNHPDHLAKRTALALVLLDARIVKSREAGINLFKIWAEPASRTHTIDALIDLANEKAIR
jgi:hypothetical protein